MATYVLVPGGGHGGWAWQKVARILAAQGHTTYAVTLTGVGDRAHLVSPDTNLETHIVDVANLLFFEDLQDVILVGHSAGGIVATGAADRAHDRVAKVVYVDAPMGPSNAEAFPPINEMRKIGQVVDGVELVVFPTEDLVAFYGVSEPDEVQWMMQRLTPHPWKALGDTLDLKNSAALNEIPRFHIVADSSIAMGAHDNLPEAERIEGQYWELEGPHDLMVVKPEEVAQVLIEIDRAPSPKSARVQSLP